MKEFLHFDIIKRSYRGETLQDLKTAINTMKAVFKKTAYVKLTVSEGGIHRTYFKHDKSTVWSLGGFLYTTPACHLSWKKIADLVKHVAPFENEIFTYE